MLAIAYARCTYLRGWPTGVGRNSGVYGDLTAQDIMEEEVPEAWPIFPGATVQLMWDMGWITCFYA